MGPLQFLSQLLSRLRPLSEGAGRVAFAIILAVSVSGGSAGCASIKAATSSVTSMATGLFSDKPATPAWRSVVVTAAADANQNTPVAVDIVFVKDQALVEALVATPAAKWFAARGEMKRSHPQALSVLSLEVVPRQSLMLTERQLRDHQGFAAFVFADYSAPGEHRERLNMKAPSLVLQLGQRGFKAAEAGKS